MVLFTNAGVYIANLPECNHKPPHPHQFWIVWLPLELFSINAFS